MGLFGAAPPAALIRLRRRIRAQMLALQPDIFVGIDAPEFNLNLAPALHRAGIATVQYVSPQVWAWRRGRARRMAQYLDQVLCLLPFEREVYDQVGLPAVFVGHPLADQLPLVPDQAAAQRELGLAADAPVVAVLPGSRIGEVTRLEIFRRRHCLVATRPGQSSRHGRRNHAVHSFGTAPAPCPRRGHAGLTDHTSCRVRTARSRRPVQTADGRRLSPGCADGRAARLRASEMPYFAQPNLLAGRRVVPELAQSEVTPERLGREIERWLDQPAEVAELQALFTTIHRQLRQGASERAAAAILEIARGRSS
jgi:lipid-A-disaccharide synthase